MKNILITGASRSIGRAIALRFAKENCRIFINCNQSVDALNEVKKEIEAQHASCELVVGNVGNAEDVRKMFAHIHSICDGIDILVNNAGIAHIGLFMDLSDEEWNRMVQTNLSSVFYCSRAAIPHMISQKSGKILNISSIWGSVGASCEVAYSATKSGVNGLTKGLAKELAPSNIQVNAIACGAIDTVMNGQLDADERQELEDEIPAGRFGTCEEVAELVYDLTMKHDYLTGQIIGLDGGW